MLVLSRKKNEAVAIGGGILITVVEVKGDRVRLGFTAPPEIKIDRAEVAVAKKKEIENERDN